MNTQRLAYHAALYHQDSETTHDKCGEYLYGPNLHWVATAGVYGYRPNYCVASDTYQDAVDGLAHLHDLGRTRKARLERNSYLDLDLRRDGNEYCEITACDCADPSVHSDE